MTIPTQRVLEALLADPCAELYGIEIGDAAGLPSGTVHPILARLEGLGWVTSRWEDIDPSAAGRSVRLGAADEVGRSAINRNGVARRGRA